MSLPLVEPQFGITVLALPPDEYVPLAEALDTVNDVAVLAVIARWVEFRLDGVMPVTVTKSPTANLFVAVYVTLLPDFTALVIVAVSVFAIDNESTVLTKVCERIKLNIELYLNLSSLKSDETGEQNCCKFCLSVVSTAVASKEDK